MKIVLIGLAAMFFVQDQDYAELIDKLGSDSVIEREEATDELTKLGAQALPALKKAAASDNAETRVRAENIIKSIQRKAKIGIVYTDPKPVTLDVADITLAELTEKLSAQTGTKFDLSGVDRERKVSLVTRGATLMPALDRLCSTTDDLSWEWGDSGVLFSKDKHVPFPASYAGPFRVRVKSLQVTRTQNFAKREANLTFTMEPDHDRYLKPLTNWKLEITKILDDQGNEVTINDPNNGLGGIMGGGGGVMVIGGLFGMGEQGLGKTFFAQKLSPDAKKLALLQGKIRYSFAIDSQEAKIEAPTRGSSVKVGPFEVTVKNIRTVRGQETTNITLSVKRWQGSTNELRKEVDARFDQGSLVIVDEKGKVHPASSGMAGGLGGMVFDIPNGQQKEVMYHFNIGKRLGREQRDVMKFKFHNETFEKSLDFEFKDLAIP